jgi:hypothetical protein
MPKLKINFHGESWTLKVQCVENDLDACLATADKMKLPLTEALLDPSSITTLKYRLSTEHLPGTKWSGLLNLAKTKLKFGTTAKKSKNSTS